MQKGGKIIEKTLFMRLGRRLSRSLFRFSHTRKPKLCKHFCLRDCEEDFDQIPLCWSIMFKLLKLITSNHFHREITESDFFLHIITDYFLSTQGWNGIVFLQNMYKIKKSKLSQSHLPLDK
jgi:hypothetical protein